MMFLSMDDSEIVFITGTLSVLLSLLLTLLHRDRTFHYIPLKKRIEFVNEAISELLRDERIEEVNINPLINN
jgi:hypothetical protein